ncbi:MAG: GGDEF domain-containing protein [Woeseiaceae bacterium]|nr:GGDEF domain-containing protein [Woeseiaceae bacterium]
MRSESKRKSVEHYLPLILSAAGALGVLPFAVIRFMAGEWIVGIVDSVIILGFLVLGTFVYRTRNVRIASYAISVLCVGGVLTSVYVDGPQQILWAFPAIVAVFYLLRPNEAVAFALVLMFALIPALLPSEDSFRTTSSLITLVVTSAFAYAFSLITLRQRIKLLQMATKDPLTGAGNRRALENKLRNAVNVFQRTNVSVSMLLIDLDHFKKVNDRHGHAAGDEILRSITEIINLRIRVTDSLYRIGGEEFVVILDGQDLHRAAHLAEQLRTLVEANELVPDHSVTISVGVAELKHGESGFDWLHRADEALYRAKRSGRNAMNIAD